VLYSLTCLLVCGVVVQLQPLSVSGIEPDRAVLNIIKQSELQQGSMLGAGAFGTVYRVRRTLCLILFEILALYKSSTYLLTSTTVISVLMAVFQVNLR